MKLCLINSAFYPAIVYGGPTYSSYYLAKNLAQLGVDVWVSAGNPNGKIRLREKTNVYHFFQPNLHVKYYHDTIIGRFSLQLMFHLWRDIRRADVVHTQDILSTVSLFALLYAWVFRKPILASPRGSLSNWALQQGNYFKRFWLKNLIGPFQKYAVFHATSQQEAADIRAIFPQAKVVIAPNGADLSVFGEAKGHNLNQWVQGQLGVEANFSHFIISLSRLHVTKGYERLLAAFPAVLAQYPGAALLLAGHDDGELANLKQQADQLGIAQRVFFVGHLDGPQKATFLASGDVFVLASHTENFGNVYLEALAAGTPIVASIYTPWEEVEQAGCGRWVDNSPEQIASAVLDLLGRNREELRQRAKALSQKFEWKLVAEQMKQYYRSLLQERSIDSTTKTNLK